MPAPLVVGAVVVGGAWLGNAIFGGDDMSEVVKAHPIWQAIQDGSPRPLQEAATLAGNHATKQEEFATNADKLAKLLGEAWEGDAAEAATKKVTKLATSARETGTALETNSKNFESQAGSFDELKVKMKPMDTPPPEGSGFLDRLKPWDTDAEDAVERNQEAAKHNLALYEQYGQTTKSNAESITDKYGNAGNPGSGPTGTDERTSQQQQQWQRQQEEMRRNQARAEAEARKAQEEARRRAEEQRRKMEEQARKAQEEARRRAEEQRRKMEEEARRREAEARQRAEEQRRRMEEEARRRQREAEERARQAREQLGKSGSYNPSGTSASSFSPSSLSGSGLGSGGSGGSFGPSGAGAGGAGGLGPDGAAAASGGKSTGAQGPGGGRAGGAGGMRGGGMGGGRGMGGMGGMMGGAGAGKGQGEDKEHKRKFQATEDPNELFGTDEKAVPPVIGDK